MNSSKDSIYSHPLGTVDAFRFDPKVVSVFPDMILRSVPGYSTIISAIGLLAARYAQKGSKCYDLGCSLGAATLSMREHITAENCKIVAIDNSPAMICNLEAQLRQTEHRVPVNLHCADIRDVPLDNASIVVLNFTLQFIPVDDRVALITKIYQGLLPGGALIVSEKLNYSDQKQNDLHSDMHHLFKKANGYSDLEISQKRSALEKVLIPETLGCHKTRLQQAGFNSAEVWFQYFNFISMIALK